MSTPDYEPKEFIAGDTVAWTKTLSDYPASAGWVLTYIFLSGNNKYVVTASADGDNHAASLTAADSADWPADDYTWHSFVTKDAERYYIGVGRTTVKPNFAIHPSGLDNRSHVKKVLDALEAMILRRATKDQQAYTVTIGGESRTISRLSPAELLKWRDTYRVEYQRELDQEAIDNGEGLSNTIYVQMP